MSANRRGGGVSLGDFNPRAAATPAHVTPGHVGSGQGAAQVSNALAQVSQRLGRAADRAARREGREAGLQAGLDPEFRRRDGDSEFDRAFNAAGTAVYLQGLEVEVSRRVTEVGESTRGDPVAMNDAFDGLADELRQSEPLQDPEILAAFEPMFARQRLGYQRQALRDEVSAQLDAHRAMADNWIDVRSNAIVREAHVLGLDETADDALAGELDTLTEQLVAFGPREAFEFRGETYEADPDRAGAYSLQQIETALSRVSSSVEQARIVGAFERLPGSLEARREFQAAFREDWEDGAYANLDAADRARLDSAMSADISRRETEARSTQREIGRALERALDDAVDVRGAGLPAREGLFEEIATRAEAIGDPALAQEAREAEGLADLTQHAWTMPPAELRTQINAMRADLADRGDVTAYEASRVTTAETVLQRMETALRQDPLSVAVRAQLIDLPALSMTDENGEVSLDTFRASLATRGAIAQTVAEHYQVPTRYFTEAERRSFAVAVETDQVSRLTVAQIIADALGPDAREALAELAPEQPALAHIGGMITAGAIEGARDADEGRRLRNEPGFVTVLPSPDDRSAEVQREYGEIARTLPTTVSRARAVADDIYTYRAARQGLTPDDFDDQLYRRALNEALGARYLSTGRGRSVQFGGSTRVRGASVIAPTWLRADRLDDVLGGLAAGDINAPGVAMYDFRGREIPLEDLRSASLASTGTGRYRVVWGESEYALTETGEDFELDLDALRAEVAQAEPEWVAP